MRKPLGRGLDALLGNATSGNTTSGNTAPAESGLPSAGGTQLTMAPVDQIAPGQYQPRIHFDQARLDELTNAIRTQGIIEPLIVRPIGAPGKAHGFELIAGERRLRAARAAGLEAVPVIVRELDDRAALEMALVENIAREDLSAVEEAIAFARLVKHFSLSHDEIAARVGVSRPYVTNAIRLLDLPQEVIELIAGGLMTAGQARPLLAIASPEAQVAAARSILAGRVSARGAEEIATVHRTLRTPERERAREELDANTSALAESLQRALKRKVRIVRRRGKSPGRIEIDYYDDNDLTALADMIAGHARGRGQHLHPGQE